ncbi:MAG: NADH-quinone oxidoreductase subunit C [bacterium]
MAKQDVIKELREKLGKKILKWQEKPPQRYYVTLPREDILEVARFIFKKQGARFIIESGVDTPVGIEVLYHFSFDRLNKIVTLKVLLPKDGCEVESIAPLIPGASFIEREIAELLGVKFLNHPDPRRLLLGKDWPEGEYPLRQTTRENQ